MVPVSAAEVLTLLAGLALSLSASAAGLWLARRTWPLPGPDHDPPDDERD
jgi:hypothetical protein